MTKRELFETLERLLSRANDNDEVFFEHPDSNLVKNHKTLQQSTIELIYYDPNDDDEDPNNFSVEWVLKLV